MPRRLDMTVTLQEGSILPLDGARRPGPDDREGLAQLLLDAYAGTIDSEEETLEEALVEVDRTKKYHRCAFLIWTSLLRAKKQQSGNSNSQ
jgi:hypothetical protein